MQYGHETIRSPLISVVTLPWAYVAVTIGYWGRGHVGAWHDAHVILKSSIIKIPKQYFMEHSITQVNTQLSPTKGTQGQYCHGLSSWINVSVGFFQGPCVAPIEDWGFFELSFLSLCEITEFKGRVSSKIHLLFLYLKWASKWCLIFWNFWELYFSR